MLTILPYAAASLPGFRFDSAEAPKFVHNLTVAKHPLERGSRNVDHILDGIPEVHCEGIISATPIDAEAFDGRLVGVIGARGTWTFPGVDPPLEAQTLLRDYQRNSALLTVVTKQGTYDNMALMSLDVTREAGHARFSLKFEQVVIASIATGNAPQPKVPKAAPKVNAGAQNGNGQAQPNKQQLTSFLWQAKNGL